MWKLALGLIGAIGLVGGGFYLGYVHEEATYLAYKDGVDQATTKAVELARADDHARDGISLAAAIAHGDHLQSVIDNFQPLIEKVKVYVTPKDDAACVINRGFVGLWDDASTQANSGADGITASQPDERPSDVKLSEVSALHTRDAKAFAEVTTDYLDLRQWVRDQVAANGKIVSNPPDQGTVAAVHTEGSVTGPIVAQNSTPYFAEAGQ